MIVTFVVAVASSLVALPVSAGREEAALAFPVFARISGPRSELEREVDRATGISGYLVRAVDHSALESLGDSWVILEDLADHRDLAFEREAFEATFDDYLVSRDPRLAVRGNCLRREPFRSMVKQRVTELPELGRARLFAISLATDPSWTYSSVPHDLCICEGCVAAWREELGARFSDPAAAASALGNDATTFAQFEPWSVDRVRAWNEDLPRAKAQLGPWLDYRESLDAGLADSFAALARAAAARAAVPVGFFGGAPTNPFGGHDWARLGAAVDLLLPPTDPTSREVVMSGERRPGQLLCALYSVGAEERFVRQHLATEFFGGATGAVIPWLGNWVTSSTLDGAPVPTALAQAARPLLDWLRSDIARAWRAATPELARVALLYSPRSLKIHWLIDAERFGIYWPTRSSLLDGELLPLARTWWGWQWLLQDLDVPYRWLAEERIDTQGEVDALAAVDVLVLPRVISLSRVAAARIRAFVARGGRVVIDGECALYDEFGNGLERGQLDDLCGVRREPEHRPWDAFRPQFVEPPPEPVLELRDLEPAVEVDPDVAAPALWLDRSLADYVDVRDLEGDPARDVRERLRTVFAAAGVTRAVEVSRIDGAPARVRVFVAQAADEYFVAVLRNELLPELSGIVGLVDPPPVRFALRLPQRCVVADVSPEPRATIDAGAVDRVEFELPLAEVLVLRCKPERR